jgi:hypothetical protein
MNTTQQCQEKIAFFKNQLIDSEDNISYDGIDVELDIFRQKFSPNSTDKQPKILIAESNNNLKNYRYFLI